MSKRSPEFNEYVAKTWAAVRELSNAAERLGLPRDGWSGKMVEAVSGSEPAHEVAALAYLASRPEATE